MSYMYVSGYVGFDSKGEEPLGRSTVKEGTKLPQKKEKYLKEVYSKNPKPDTFLQQKLCEQLDLTPSQVRRWFTSYRQLKGRKSKGNMWLLLA